MKNFTITWQRFMLESTAEQLIFIDESLFKLQSGWCFMIYASIDAPAHYHDDMIRGSTWSILPAYTVNDYLLCTDIKKSFYNSDQFYIWVLNSLLSHLNPYFMYQSIVCLDNLSIHLDPWVWQAIEGHRCLLKFLPPYSPDYSSIELSFSLLKAWFQCHLMSQCVSRGGAKCGRHLVLTKTFYKGLKLCGEVIYIRCTGPHTPMLTQLINLQTPSHDISSPLNRPSFMRQCSFPQPLPQQGSLPQPLPQQGSLPQPLPQQGSLPQPLPWWGSLPQLGLQGIGAMEPL